MNFATFNPNYALELRHEGVKRNKFKCFLGFGIAVPSLKLWRHANRYG